MPKLNTTLYLRVTAIVLMLFGLTLAVLTGTVMHILNIKASPEGVLFIRFLGASMLGHAYINWLGSHFEWRTLRHVLLMNVVVLSLAVFLDAINLLSNPITPIWLAIFVMHALFLIGFIVAALDRRPRAN